VSGSLPELLGVAGQHPRKTSRRFPPDELMLVIDYKHEHWKGLKDYQYMRPKTLFIPGNFRLSPGSYTLGKER
jgi:hypothetical protein